MLFSDVAEKQQHDLLYHGLSAHCNVPNCSESFKSIGQLRAHKGEEHAY